MKIGILCSPTYGGSGVVATELGRELAQRGHQIHFISTAMPFRLAPEVMENIYFHEVQAMNYPVLPGELYGIAIASKTHQVAQDFGLDIVHAHYALPHAVSAWLAREAFRGPRPFRVVTTLHGTDITLVGRAPSFFPIVQLAMERSDAVTTVSEWLREETVREFSMQRPIDVVPNFVDVNRFRRSTSSACIKSHFAPKGEKLLLHVSNFRPVKRIPDVIRTFDLVRREVPSKLLMVGDGPERDAATKQARDLGLQGDVVFLGKQERIESFFACADLMLFPSEYESFGLAALEAMACENVVVSSRGGGLAELIEHGVDGYLADVGDVEAMARHAVTALSDDTLRARIGRKARRTVTSKYLPEQIVPLYEGIYQRVINA